MFSLFSPFTKQIFTKSDISKPLTQKVCKSLFVMYTAPFSKGSKVSIDRFDGVVQSVNLWYVKLKSKGKSVFMPTSFIYDKIIEVYD